MSGKRRSMLLEPSPFWVTVLYITGHCQDSQEQVEETKTGQLDICRFGCVNPEGKESERSENAAPLCLRIVACAYQHVPALLPRPRACAMVSATFLHPAWPGHTRIPVVGYAVPGPTKQADKQGRLGLGPDLLPFPSSLFRCSCSHLPFPSFIPPPPCPVLHTDPTTAQDPWPRLFWWNTNLPIHAIAARARSKHDEAFSSSSTAMLC